MASSILQLSPHQHQHQSDNSTSNHNHNQLHPEESSDSINNNKVAYDLRRLKVYSSCLRCRTKKVKCDRKEPCSRCQKHNVECSYRELTSVQLDIRQFQRHLNNPKIRKDGAGIITSTATPVIASSSSHTSPSPVSAAASSSTITFSSAPSPPIIHYNIHNNNNNNNNNCPVDYTTDAFPTTATSPNLNSSSSPSTSNSNSPSLRKGMMMIKSESSSATSSCIDAESCANLLLAVSAKNINNKTAAIGASAIDRVRIHKIHRRKLSSKPTKPVPDCIYGNSSMCMALSDINDHVDKVQLSESSSSRPSPPISNSNPASVSVPAADPAPAYRRFSSDSDDIEDNNANVPIWRAQAVGKHTQTVHEQDMAETFGLAAYLKAKEMEISQDPGRAGQTIDYEKELERALEQRMPSSFSRPDRSRSRAQKNGQSAYNHATPYARPSYCQLSPSSSSSTSARAGSPSSNNASTYAQQPPPTVQCCCQIAAMQGQALGSCPYSNVSHGGYENHNNKPMLASPPTSTRSATAEHDESARIAYSPSYSPSYAPRDIAPVPESTTSPSSSSFTLPQLKISSNWPSSSAIKLPSMLTSPTSPCSPSMRMDLSSPRTELAPIRLPVSTPASAPSEFEVGRDGEEPIQIDCKYNEPNVDAWDLIEKPISRTVPLTTKRGRSIKMEMGWILS
ncbi:hypothetical protein BG015_011247 [Linnemannia schmuckeri]|uniref:Zn(2)-C6 fungal-type domain-containing protein n=1 Tax=Linnemannia schmuckeri TaxID=64567 RepID=A0A9P5RVM8_9FUNG|nr:hypothetical protein BG015_011247 [Linnemannia schmuckeri]